MIAWLRERVRRAYLRELKHSIETPPRNIAVIQDGSWQQARTQRAIALVRALAATGYQDRPRVVQRLRSTLTAGESEEFANEINADERSG